MAILFYKYNEKQRLYLFNDNNNFLLDIYEFDDKKEFSIQFIHSVNNSPVIDYYTIDDNNNIIITQTTYYDFGAGVQTELNNNEKIKYGNNGEMTVTNINKIISPLVYIVGTVSHHTMNINNNSIILDEKYGRNTHIRFEVKGGR